MISEREHEREYRVVNQMISMHAYIAQAKKSQALYLSIGLIFTSALTCAFTFADDEILRALGIGAGRERLVMGLASSILFALSIIELRVDWGGVARAHEDAKKRLSLLKAKYRTVSAMPELESQGAWSELSKEYSETLASIVEIPEKSFGKLKAHHHYKVELSRAIDKHIGVPVFFLAIALRSKTTWAYLRSKPFGEE